MKQLMTLGLLVLLTLSSLAAERNTVNADLKTVTVYKSGAEMTHTTNAYLKQGNNELVIDRISNQIDINSIQIKTEAGITIMGIEFNNNYLVPVEKTARVVALEDSMERMQKEVGKLEMAIANNNDLIEVLKANRDIKGSQTGLSVAELMKLMDYYKLKLGELQTESATLQEKRDKLNANLARINNQIAEEQRKNTSTAGRLVLQLSAAMAGKADFTISYIATNAYWVPFYDIRVDNTKSPMQLIQKARIVQTTGIDWKQVKLSLSTSLPSQWGTAPLLNAWFLSYINPVRKMNARLKNVAMANTYTYDTMDKEEAAAADYKLRIRGMASVNSGSEPLYVVNGNIMSSSDFAQLDPSSIKSVEVLKDANATALYGARAANGVVVATLKSGLDDYVSVSDNTLNTSFDIDLPYDVPTNGKAQTATLTTTQVATTYKHYAVPKLDNDAYLLAQVANWEKLSLLPGEANIIFEGTYVGKSFIDPNATTDTLSLTLGKDKRVVLKREKVADFSSVKFLGNNKLQKFTYQITVKNTKKEAIDLLLKDQYPLTTNKEIEVELVDAGGADVNADLGVLNWKMTLAPGESRKIKFVYSVKYPKDKTLNL